jgi:hypothetical protein
VWLSFALRSRGHDEPRQINNDLVFMAVNNKRFKFSISSGGTTLIYSLRLNATVYEPVTAALGISLASDSDNFNGIGTVNDLRRAGKLVKVRATGKNTAGKIKTFSLWCAVSELDNAIAKLPTKKIGDYDIISAGLSLTTRYH